ncbi:MAG: pirin family protein [Spirochaetota bacterium]|nr:pirin family protein [Spirochaetota bacterium]
MSGKYLKHKAQETMDGDGARVKRLFPVAGKRHHDPFVLLDEFFVDSSAGFPTHPHRGFEGITYMMEGQLRHQDNLGNDTTVKDGGIQRFTAGKGMEHSEMPQGEGLSHGFQLWVNLPKRLKSIEPDYQQVNKNEIPEKTSDGVMVRTIVGDGSPVEIKTAIRYLDVQLSEGKNFDVNVTDFDHGIVYVSAGSLSFESEKLCAGEALLLEKGDKVNLEAESQCRFIVLLGEAHGEPIIQHGPFVD